MSDRILELSVEAERLADEATNAFNDETGNWICTWNEVYDQKFAELIIRECAAYLNGAMEVRNQAEQDLCDHAARKIKEHFGVE